MNQRTKMNQRTFQYILGYFGKNISVYFLQNYFFMNLCVYYVILSGRLTDKESLDSYFR